MEIVTVEYMRRRQVSQYEPEELKVVGNLSEGEDWKESFEQLRQEVNEALGLVAAKAPKKAEEKKVEEPAKTTKKKVAKKTAKKVAKKTTKAVKEEAEEVTYTNADVKEHLVKVIKANGKAAAVGILEEHGYGHSSEVTEEDYGNVIESCKKLLG
jgi:hypothetical protein